MSHTTLRQLIAPTAAATLVLLLGATPASARPEAGPPATGAKTTAKAADTSNCPLQRVGSQLVKCDNLTGNGVAAPGWVTSQQASAATASLASQEGSEASAAETSAAEQDALTKFRRHGI